MDGPPLSEWNATGALEIWLREKKHKELINQLVPAEGLPEQWTVSDNSDQKERSFCLDDWEE